MILKNSFLFIQILQPMQQLTGGVLESALDEILERITQDIFNASVAKW